MKSSLIVFFLFTLASSLKAQKLYKASNGVTYNIGDTIVMDKGAGVEGRFLSLGMTGLAAIGSVNQNGNSDQLNATRAFAGGRGVIKKIKQMKFAGNIKPYFIIDFHQGPNYMLLIEDAISSCEITPCKNNN